MNPHGPRSGSLLTVRFSLRKCWSVMTRFDRINSGRKGGWNWILATSNEGRESNVLRRSSMRCEFAVQKSVVTVWKVYGIANEETSIRTNVLKDGKDPPRKQGGISNPKRLVHLVRKVNVPSIGAGSQRSGTSCGKRPQPLCLISKETIRPICGRNRLPIPIEVERLTHRGTSPDRSRYAPAIDIERTSISHHNLGVERNVTRQCEQTAVALIRSRSSWKKAGMIARISGGRRFIGGRVFFRRFAFDKILTKSEAYLSICAGRVRSDHSQSRGGTQTSSHKTPE